LNEKRRTIPINCFCCVFSFTT